MDRLSLATSKRRILLHEISYTRHRYPCAIIWITKVRSFLRPGAEKCGFDTIEAALGLPPGGGIAMRAEAQQRLNDLRWLREADQYLESARAELRGSPDDEQRRAFIRLTEEVVTYERQRLGMDTWSVTSADS